MAPRPRTLRGGGRERLLGSGPSVSHTLNTSLEPRTASVGEFTIAVLDVTPYPKSTTVILPEEYTVRIRVEV